MKIEIGTTIEYGRTSYYDIPFTVIIDEEEYTGSVSIVTYSSDNISDYSEYLNLDWDNRPEKLADEELSELESDIIDLALEK